MKIIINQFVKEIEIDDLLQVSIERSDGMKRTIKKLTIKLDDQLSFVIRGRDDVMKEYRGIKKMILKDRENHSEIVDLSDF